MALVILIVSAGTIESSEEILLRQWIVRKILNATWKGSAVEKFVLQCLKFKMYTPHVQLNTIFQTQIVFILYFMI